MDTFLTSLVNLYNGRERSKLGIAQCRELLQLLHRQLTSDGGEADELTACKGMRIVGQDALVDRIVMAFVLNEHLLLEGLPGVAKSETVKYAAIDTGLVSLRVQFFPDMLPSDLVGKNAFDVFKLHAAANGQADAEQDDIEQWKNGPLFSNLLVADEINRAPSKVQAALLEAMGERQITPLGHSTHVIRSSREWEMWLRHIRRLEQAKRIKGDIWGHFAGSIGAVPADDMTPAILAPVVGALCNQNLLRMGGDFPFGAQFGWTDPDPLCGATSINLSFPKDAQQTVFATQNPIEQSGTFPMSEAQVDRFMMKHTVHYPDLPYLMQIARMINRPQPSPDPDRFFNCPPERETNAELRNNRDLAIRCSLYFLRRCRELLFGPPGTIAGPLKSLFSSETSGTSPLEKMARLVFLSHVKMTRTTRESEAESLLLDVEQQQRMRFLHNSCAADSRPLSLVADCDMFEYVSSGASPRGILALCRASLAYAFLKGTGDRMSVTDEHIREMAPDTLAHRIRLNSQARVRDIKSSAFLDRIMDSVLDNLPTKGQP